MRPTFPTNNATNRGKSHVKQLCEFFSSGVSVGALTPNLPNIFHGQFRQSMTLSPWHTLRTSTGTMCLPACHIFWIKTRMVGVSSRDSLWIKSRVMSVASRMISAPFGFFILHVVRRRSDPQVREIAAGWIIAMMQNFRFVIGRFTESKEPRDAMRLVDFVFQVHAAVTMIVSVSLKFKASVRLAFKSGKESFLLFFRQLRYCQAGFHTNFLSCVGLEREHCINRLAFAFYNIKSEAEQ